MPELRFDDRFQCLVRGVSYNFSRKHGLVYVDYDSCVDMQGCIDFFKSIDPDVESIITVAETDDGVNWNDSGYRLDAKGSWKWVAPEMDPHLTVRTHWSSRENWTLDDVAAFTNKSRPGVRAAVANRRLPAPHFVSDYNVRLWSAKQVMEQFESP